MAGITNLPFRIIARRCGAALVATEMISAMGLILRQKKTMELLKSHPDERPLAVQIFGSDPERLSEAARIVSSSQAEILDINMGCPVRKVVKTGAGGALLRDPRLIEKIISRVKAACSLPVTVKIRSGWSPAEDRFEDVLRAAEAGGADAVTVHGRYVVQGFSGKADWSRIALAKRMLRIPVIGNGDVTSRQEALSMMDATGCDGVMIGRAATSNPWIFDSPLIGGEKPLLTHRASLIEEHCRLIAEHMDPRRAGFLMRGVLIRYTKGLSSSTAFRSRISNLSRPEELLDAARQYLAGLSEDHQ
jgi:nifR3 family TIM-barrel protein